MKTLWRQQILEGHYSVVVYHEAEQGMDNPVILQQCSNVISVPFTLQGYYNALHLTLASQQASLKVMIS